MQTKNAPLWVHFRFNWLRGKDLNQRPPGYEPDELPTALPRDIDLFVEKPFGAGNRAWTGTRGESHGILSPGRLPIPPFRRSHLLFDSIPYKRAFVNTEFQFFEAFRWIFLNHTASSFSHNPSLLRHTENNIAEYPKRACGNTQCFHIAQRLLLYLSFELWQPTIGMERLVAELP